MLGLLMNYSNINAESNVLIVENTKGLISAAVAEREVQYGLRVEFCQDSLKFNNEIMRQTFPHLGCVGKIGAVNSNLLI